MNYKKFISFFIVLIFFLFPISSIADEYNSEETDLNLDIKVSNNLNEIPTINSRNSVILDRASKSVLFGKCENEICKMASTTKIITCIVVLENTSNLQDLVTISKKAARNTWF